MDNPIEIKITLDQPLYDPNNVPFKEIDSAEGTEIGLNDKFGIPITNGCIVETTATVSKYFTKGERLKCVWNIPQHRYGFFSLHINKMDSRGMEDIIQNPSNIPDCHFYATPRNASKLKVVG